MVDQEYIKKRWELKKQLYHLVLGVTQCVQNPLLLILLLPIIGITYFAFENRDTVKKLIDMPEILSPVWDVIINTYSTKALSGWLPKAAVISSFPLKKK